MKNKVIIAVILMVMGVAAIPFIGLTILFVSSAMESSRDHKKAEANDSGSSSSSISADGRFIAFISDDARLPGGDEEKMQAFIYDNETKSIVLASTDQQGEAANNGVDSSGQLDPRISADGSTLVFLSYSPNLVEGSKKGLFAKNLDTGELRLVMTSDDDSRRVDDLATSFDISRDGQLTVYCSRGGVFIHDAEVNETTQVDIDELGGELSDAVPGYYGSAISEDGRYVAFTLSKKLAKNRNNHDSQINIYVKDMQTGELRLASVDAAGQTLDYSTHPVLSKDGKWLVFEYDNSVQLHEVKTGKTVQIAKGTDPAISPSGRYIVFQYQEYEISKMDCNTNTKCANVFLFDREMNSVLRAVVPSDWKSGSSRIDHLSVGDNGDITFSADAAFEGIESEGCLVHVKQDEKSSLVDVYCRAVYRRDSSGELKRISGPPPE